VSVGCRRTPTAKHNIDTSKVMPAKISIIGQTFGRLKVISELPSEFRRDRRRRMSFCKCVCGNTKKVLNESLRLGTTTSCGCAQPEQRLAASRANLHHGHTTNGTQSPTWKSWRSMVERCKYPSSVVWKYYGGRGIKVCERWERFENFLYDMKERPIGKSLDRIDPNGNYEPSNCRWATPLEQSQNRRPRVVKIR